MSDLKLEFAAEADRATLLDIHKRCRFDAEFPLVPEYALATRDSGYYERQWKDHFPTRDSATEVIKATGRGPHRRLLPVWAAGFRVVSG